MVRHTAEREELYRAVPLRGDLILINIDTFDIQDGVLGKMEIKEAVRKL